MKAPAERGYILASVTVVMLILALTATAILASATHQLRRTHALETRLVEHAQLQGLARLAATELSISRQNRSMRYSETSATLDAFGLQATIEVVSESAKLDLNRAGQEALALEARRLGWNSTLVEAFVTRVQEVRMRAGQLGLVDDAIPASQPILPCLHERFTVFGGRDEQTSQPSRFGASDRASAGTRLAVTVTVDGFDEAVTAVFLMLGDPDHPAEVMDMRFWPMNEQRPCHENA